MSRRLTTAEFIKTARKVHGRKYDYSKTKYINANSRVVVTCPRHGDFKPFAANHWKGHGCARCAQISGGLHQRLTTQQFLQKAKQIHGNRFNYRNAVYVTAKRKIEIVCRIHGIFEQAPYSHLAGNGCPKCWKEKPAYNHLDPKIIVKRIETAHPNLVVVKTPRNTRDHTLVRCKTCRHIWSASPCNLTFSDGSPKSGCPRCFASSGEAAVYRFLEANNLRFEPQVRLIPRKAYQFDFQLTGRKTLIEYHGGQHYFAVDFGGHGRAHAKKQFLAGQRRDRLKAKWAAENGYELIVIPYWESVEEFLTKRLLLKKAA